MTERPAPDDHSGLLGQPYATDPELLAALGWSGSAATSPQGVFLAMDPDSLDYVAALPDSAIDLGRAALLLAREMSDTGLAPEPWLAELDRLAAVARPRLAGRGLREQLARLARLLFDEQGFRGNTVDYYDPRNNFLNEVLARRLGVPISLALVMVEVGRRAGLTVYGVGLPGHFVVGASAGDERVYVDAFNAGAELDAAGMIRLIEAALGGPAVLDREWLRPVTPREFVGRLCANLQGAYLLQNDLARAIRATERQFLFGGDPDSLRDLGFLYIQTGQLQRAASALESYLLNRPHVEDAEEVQAGLQAVYQRLALSG